MKALTHGFTIVELLVTSLILLIILSIILSSTNSAVSLYQADQSRIGATRNGRSTLDVLGQDIQQTGERLSSDFPAVKITADVNGNSVLTLRRGLGDSAFPLCAPVPGAGQIYINTNNPFLITNPSAVPNLPVDCKPTTLSASNWNDALASSPDGTIGMIMDFNTNTSSYFPISGVSDTPVAGGLVQQVITTPALPTVTYNPVRVVGGPAPDIRVYLIEERKYSVVGSNLMLAQNQQAAQPATPQIVSFVVTPYLKPVAAGGTPTVATLPFPPTPVPGTATPDWKDLAYLKVNLTVKDVTGSKVVTRTMSAQVTPRNAGSF